MRYLNNDTIYSIARAEISELVEGSYISAMYDIHFRVKRALNIIDKKTAAEIERVYLCDKVRRINKYINFTMTRPYRSPIE